MIKTKMVISRFGEAGQMEEEQGELAGKENKRTFWGDEIVYILT